MWALSIKKANPNQRYRLNANVSNVAATDLRVVRCMNF
jgi:hypothetical protein